MEEQRVQKINIDKRNEYYSFLKYLCKVSKNLYNQALFIQRQHFIDSGYYENHNDLDKLAKIKGSPLYKNYHILPAQVAQQTLKVLDKNWKSFFESIKAYKKNPNKFTGRPKMPKYKDSDSYFNLYITEQSLHFENNILRISNLSGFIKNIYIKCNLLKIDNIKKINQLRILPRNNKLVLEIIYTKIINETKFNGKQSVGIDLGIDNLLTITGDVKPIIVSGKKIKSINHHYNKLQARYKSELQKKNKKYWSNRLQKITDKRKNKIEDAFHKISRWLITFCLENGISNIVIGKNTNWKQNSKMNKTNNQNFIQIPFTILENMIDYKAREVGLNVIWQEESYTSKASYFNNDKIPKFKKDDTTKHQFSGKRIKRGLYRTKEGKFVNADVNGSLNILRKSNVTVMSKLGPADIGFVFSPIKINIF